MIDTLYETIGGRQKINAAVESFYAKVLADESLCPFFNGTQMEGLRAKQSMFLSMLLGGKIVYTGKDIGDAHAHPCRMGMTGAHFDSFLNHFRTALEEVGVRAEPLAKIMAQLEEKRDAVLGR